MKCLKCGAENSAEAKFCKSCGQQMVKKEKKKNYNCCRSYVLNQISDVEVLE